MEMGHMRCFQFKMNIQALVLILYLCTSIEAFCPRREAWTRQCNPDTIIILAPNTQNDCQTCKPQTGQCDVPKQCDCGICNSCKDPPIYFPEVEYPVMHDYKPFFFNTCWSI